MRWGVGKRKVQVTIHEATGTHEWIGKNKMRQEVTGLAKGQQMFSIKSPKANTLSVRGHMVSVSTTYLCCCCRKVAIDDM